MIAERMQERETQQRLDKAAHDHSLAERDANAAKRQRKAHKQLTRHMEKIALRGVKVLIACAALLALGLIAFGAAVAYTSHPAGSSDWTIAPRFILHPSAAREPTPAPALGIDERLSEPFPVGVSCAALENGATHGAYLPLPPKVLKAANDLFARIPPNLRESSVWVIGGGYDRRELPATNPNASNAQLASNRARCLATYLLTLMCKRGTDCPQVMIAIGVRPEHPNPDASVQDMDSDRSPHIVVLAAPKVSR